jgi:formylglycine-generating enzyme required for sulfatase activity/predicted Ser/Thr protein kinase
MDARRWAKVRELYEHCSELPSAARSAWLRRHSDGDGALVLEVEQLLAAEPPFEGFLAPPLGGTNGGVAGGCIAGGGAAEGHAAEGAVAQGCDAQAAPSPAEMGAPHAGLVPLIAGFRLIRALGSGGMGTVWLAEQLEPQRRVALKTLRAGVWDEAVQRRFALEARLLARLRHPAIAQIYTVGTFRGEDGGEHPYFAMEYVEGGRTLSAWAKGTRASTQACLELYAEICEGVQHGHGRGVIHRDLKSANVLVDCEGRPKIIDFGIARDEEDAAGQTRLTQTGQVVGTLQSMAPEQLGLVDALVDARTDVYALGGILYELLTGRPPFEHTGGLGSFLALRMQGLTPDLSAARPDLSRDISWILSRAMEHEPTRRYPTAQALGDDVKRFLAHEPVSARPASTGYLLRKFVRRHRVGVLGATAVLATALIGGVGVGISLARERQRSLQVLQLSDERRLRELTARETQLPAPGPSAVDSYATWLRDADELLGRLEGHRATRDRLALEIAAGGLSATELTARTWWHESLSNLAAELERFDEQPHGIAARVREQGRWCAELADATIRGPRASAAWAKARAALADRTVAPRYDGLELSPQLGLLPLGPDPQSGLWEFAHLLSGSPAQRDANGALQITESTGIVFVLLPGGRFTMGARRPDVEHPLGTPNVDPWCFPTEGPPLEIALAPYFLAKHELSQAQWLRLTGTNPSQSAAARTAEDWLRPVESITWEEASLALSRVGLVLPTEAQWEYAARAGTVTPWYLGADSPADWNAHEHLDASPEQFLPIGSLLGNPYGMHDMIGNVSEWCLDVWHDRAHGGSAIDAATGERRAAGGQQRVKRGASARLSPESYVTLTRSSWTMNALPDSRTPQLGARAARALDP